MADKQYSVVTRAKAARTRSSGELKQSTSAVGATGLVPYDTGFSSLFERVNIGTEEAPLWIIRAKLSLYSVGEIVSGYTGEAEEGDAVVLLSLGALTNVNDDADLDESDIPSSTTDKILIRKAGSTMWETADAGTLGGGTAVQWGTEDTTAKTIQLILGAVSKVLSLSDHTHAVEVTNVGITTDSNSNVTSGSIKIKVQGVESTVLVQYARYATYAHKAVDGNAVASQTWVQNNNKWGTTNQTGKTVQLTIGGALKTLSLSDHTHSGYASSSHDHGDIYAAKNHSHDYATSDHDHNGVYAQQVHSHSNAYAAKTHDHNGVYAEAGHNHDAAYHPLEGLYSKLFKASRVDVSTAASNAARTYIEPNKITFSAYVQNQIYQALINLIYESNEMRLNFSSHLKINGNVYSTGDHTGGVASDRRLKANIRTLTEKDAADVLSRLNPVSFVWNDKARELNSDKFGIARSFIADEFLKVLPNAGRRIWEDYDAIFIEQTIPYLVKGWQLQQKKIEEQEKRITYLEERLNNLARVMEERL